MSTHAGALFIAALAYAYSRRYAHDARLAFGTGKLGDLAAFASAIVLAMIALLIGYESIERFIFPQQIAFDQAIPIAALGLGVNLLSAYLLHDGHEHGSAHAHHHGHQDNRARDHVHEHNHEWGGKDDRARGDAAIDADHNLRAAFVHVTADAAVSVLVIIGLLLGRQFGWLFMDPLMGLIATVVILIWSWTLIRSAGAVLIDACPEPALARRIAERIELKGDRIADLHLWRVGPGHLAAVISVVSDEPRLPSQYKKRLAGLPGLSHITIEVERCPGEHPHD